jgi:hypothetical protein
MQLGNALRARWLHFTAIKRGFEFGIRRPRVVVLLDLPASTPSWRGEVVTVTATRRTRGFPARAITISSPAAASSTRRERCVLAWCMFTVFMN